MNKLLLLPLMLIAGCANQAPPVVINTETFIVPTPPKELTDCSVTPLIPSDTVDAYSVSRVILQLHYAHQDCRTTLHELVKWLSEVDPQASK